MPGKRKGLPKTGGKQKGSVNKTTQQARELFVNILEGEVEHIKQAFEDVRIDDPAKYLDLFAKYAKYFVPQQIQVTDSEMSIKIIRK
jgi:hypothetical protein